MRTMRSLLVLLVAFAALAVAAAAVAGTVARWPVPQSTAHTAKPAVTPAVVLPTAATLPAATYPWVQPVWTRVGAVTLPALPRATGATTTQPPAWIAID